MNKAEELFLATGNGLKDSEKGHLFGKPCFKIKGKAYICFFEEEMVFKLTGSHHTEALALSGAQLFDPSKKKRPMKEWVQVPYAHNKRWDKYAEEALKYVSKKYS